MAEGAAGEGEGQCCGPAPQAAHQGGGEHEPGTGLTPTGPGRSDPSQPAEPVASRQVASANHEGERALREALQVQSGQQAQLQLMQQRWLQEQEPHLRQARPLPALAAPTGAPHLHPSSYILLSGALGQGHLSLAQQRLPSSHEEPLPGAQGPEASCLSGK